MGPSRLRGSGTGLRCAVFQILTQAAADKKSASVRRLPCSDRPPGLSIDRAGALSLRLRRLGAAHASSEEARGMSRREYAWLFAIRASSRLTPRASGGGERPARGSGHSRAGARLMQRTSSERLRSVTSGHIRERPIYVTPLRGACAGVRRVPRAPGAAAIAASSRRSSASPRLLRPPAGRCR
jgi:hypothetical protein